MQTKNEDSIHQATQDTPPAARITHVFERAQHEGHSVLIPYFMCGYPSASQSIELVMAAVAGGADIIELGMPFSDPLADGATIQHAGHRALERGMTIKGCMETARKVAAQCSVPLLLMGYYNPVMAYGLERFCQEAAVSGVCGFLIPDLPPEEAAPLQQIAYRYGLALIFMVPPTTSDDRIAQIVKVAANSPGGFLYCVSLSGVTGSRAALPPHIHSFITRVRGYTKEYDLPLVVGFGLSTPEHIAAVTKYAEGAVVGSALVNLIDQQEESYQVAAVKDYIESLKKR